MISSSRIIHKSKPQLINISKYSSNQRSSYINIQQQRTLTKGQKTETLLELIFPASYTTTK